jgi:hypothetical protein
VPFHTGAAAGALVLVDITGLLGHGDLEVAHVPLDTIHFSVGQGLDIVMTAELDHLWCEDSRGAVIGGKGLVQLGHVAADAGPFLHQIDLEAGAECR